MSKQNRKVVQVHPNILLDEVIKQVTATVTQNDGIR